MRYKFDPRYGVKELFLHGSKSKLSHKIGPEATKSFDFVIKILRAAPSELQIREMESLHYEQLDSRGPERSVRVTPGRWRLVLWPKEDLNGKYLWLKCIENYHDDKKGKKKRGPELIPDKVDYIVETDENLTPAREMNAHPGEILKFELDARGLSQADLAKIIDRPEQVVSEIITGAKRITPETAIQIGAALGTGPEIWMNLEANYRLDLARQKVMDEGISKRARMYAIAPIGEMVKRAWIKPGATLERSLCSFLRLQSIWDEPAAPASLRASMERGPEMYSVTAWLRRVEDLSEGAKVEAFDSDALRAAMPDIAALSVDPASVGSIPATLASLGVVLVLVPHLRKTYLDGGTIWLDEQPVVAMTLRYDRIDHFYFTLMHELAHVVLGHHDALAETVKRDKTKNPHENAANSLAAKILVPSRDLSRISGMASGAGLERLPEIAATIPRHPGILVGHLHYQGLPYQRGTRHLVKVNSHLSERLDQPAA